MPKSIPIATEEIVPPSRFKPPKKALRYKVVMQIELHYFKDGEIWSQLKERRGKKWGHISTCYSQKAPSWDLLHKCHYIGNGRKCFQPPAPVSSLISHMKYTEHCLSIGRKP